MRAAYRVVQNKFYSLSSPEEHLDLAWHQLEGMRIAIRSMTEKTELSIEYMDLLELKADCAKFQSALEIGLTSRP